MTAARARTQTTRSRVKCTNHEATAPPHIQQEKELNNEKKKHTNLVLSGATASQV